MRRTWTREISPAIYLAMLRDALGHSVRQSLDEAHRPCTYRLLSFWSTLSLVFCCHARDSSPCSVWAFVLRSVSFRSYNITFSSKLFPFPLQDVWNSVLQSQALLDSWVAASSYAPTNQEFFPTHHLCKTFSESIVTIAQEFLVNGHVISINDVIFLCFT